MAKVKAEMIQLVLAAVFPSWKVSTAEINRRETLVVSIRDDICWTQRSEDYVVIDEVVEAVQKKMSEISS